VAMLCLLLSSTDIHISLKSTFYFKTNTETIFIKLYLRSKIKKKMWRCM